jgi:hypothetical protein
MATYVGPGPTNAIAYFVRCGNQTSLSFMTALGLSYSVEYKNDLSTGSWINLRTVAGTGQGVSIIDPNANTSQRFYRIAIGPPF